MTTTHSSSNGAACDHASCGMVIAAIRKAKVTITLIPLNLELCRISALRILISFAAGMWYLHKYYAKIAFNLHFKSQRSFVTIFMPLLFSAALYGQEPVNPDIVFRPDSLPAAETVRLYDTLYNLSLIHISEPTRRTPISYAVFCL